MLMPTSDERLIGKTLKDAKGAKSVVGHNLAKGRQLGRYFDLK